jgi:hypothetical protein
MVNHPISGSLAITGKSGNGHPQKLLRGAISVTWPTKKYSKKRISGSEMQAISILNRHPVYQQKPNPSAGSNLIAFIIYKQNTLSLILLKIMYHYYNKRNATKNFA